eukprot:347405-Prymnesium_polylepis.1
MNVHFANAQNTHGRMKQMGVHAPGGGGLRSARVFFPSSSGVHMYDLLSGKQLRSLKGHFGDATCCIAAADEHRVFSGGEDKAINVWTPPPCG